MSFLNNLSSWFKSYIIYNRKMRKFPKWFHERHIRLWSAYKRLCFNFFLVCLHSKCIKWMCCTRKYPCPSHRGLFGFPPPLPHPSGNSKFGSYFASKILALRSFYMWKTKLLIISVYSFLYWLMWADIHLAIKVQTSYSEFTPVFCCTGQLVLVAFNTY